MMRASTVRLAGISGMAVHVPPFKVELKDWCEWTGNDFGKVGNVIGSSFRVPGNNENAYTMAASAVMKLLEAYNIDGNDIGFLGLGTESSTDNSAGAVIVKGMVDAALVQLGKTPISRNVEVPEFKHACLGGVYAMKNACRFVDTDSSNKLAIVVASDIAEYERGSTGEPTQGAGAVAMLIEKKATMIDVHYHQAGKSASYRGPDFRKPVARHFSDKWATTTPRVSDFPVFSGPYSTTVYTDTTIHSVEDMLHSMGLPGGAGTYFDELSAIFFHRPYKMMPIQAMSVLYVRGLVRGQSRKDHLKELCEKAGVSIEQLEREMEQDSKVDPFAVITETGEPPVMHKATGKVAKVLRSDPVFKELLATKMGLGQEKVSQFGNLYSASLPAWLAVGMEDAASNGVTLSGKNIVAIGYGSGDASEAIPMTVLPTWKESALKINTLSTLQKSIPLTKEEYEAIHDTREDSAYPPYTPSNEFFIHKVGDRVEPAFQDLGVEYYTYAASKM
eukprot:TRINITY_DN9013_c5_g1_i1.p1 TRINITY_DN9013_c5_g1~~TRINITY_DN9013_c5_g1_i1.p1  ORF type:complete len:526 (+),score=98.84 TRINITY_DN9013_c5_g1_i1:71-1579(+)